MPTLKSNVENISKAITAGKEIMRNSVDPCHDLTHAELVEKKGFEVYEELKTKNFPGIDDLPRELVSVAAYWHDCYKATKPDFQSRDNFIEGEKSAEIMDKQLKPLMHPDEYSQVRDAVKNHAGKSILRYAFKPKKCGLLNKILLEADGYETINASRYKVWCMNIRSNSEIFWIFVALFQYAWLPLYFKTEATKKHFFKRFWELWKTCIFRDGYAIKILLGKYGKKPA